MDNSPEKEELIDRYLTGMADEAEVEQLDAWLKEDEQLRKTFLTATRMDSHIRERSLEQPVKKEAGSSGPPTLRFRWINPGAAAGLLIGLFSASVVWATIPQAGGIIRTSQEVVTESFEDPDLKLKPMIPNRANQWFGPLVSVAPEGGVSAVQGSRVGQLSPNPGNRAESVRYVVDLDDYPELAPGHVQSLQVRVSFSDPFTGQKPKFRVALTAFSEAPRDVREAWIMEREVGDRVLQQVVRNYLPPADEMSDWHEVSASLEIPEGSRSVVISLGVFHLNPDKPVSNFYLDAIEVRLVDTFLPSS